MQTCKVWQRGMVIGGDISCWQCYCPTQRGFSFFFLLVRMKVPCFSSTICWLVSAGQMYSNLFPPSHSPCLSCSPLLVTSCKSQYFYKILLDCFTAFVLLYIYVNKTLWAACDSGIKNYVYRRENSNIKGPETAAENRNGHPFSLQRLTVAKCMVLADSFYHTNIKKMCI